jgi:hypothetical protein
MKTLFLALVFGAVSALGLFAQSQSAPGFTVSSGTALVTTKVCNDSTNVGSIYTQLGNPSVTYVCQQVGASVSGLSNGGAFSWVAASSTANNCGTSATCATPALLTVPLKFVTGTQAMSSATTVGISGLPTFTSATSYSCSVSNANGHAYTSGVEITSATAFTIVSGTSNSDTWIYFCAGY